MWRALRDGEGWHRALVDASPTGILVIQDRHWVFANEYVVRMLGGRSADELIGRPVFEVVDPVSHALVAERLQALDSGRGNEPVDLVVRRMDGSTMLVETRSVPITVHGRPAALVIARDVTESRRVRREREITLRLLRVLNEPGDAEALAERVTRFLRDGCPCDTVGMLWAHGNRLRYRGADGGDASACAENQLCAVMRQAAMPRRPDGKPALACLCGQIMRREVHPAIPCFTPYGSFWTNDLPGLLKDAPPFVRALMAEYECNACRYLSAALIPLCQGDEVVGVLQLNDRKKDRFSEDWVAFLENTAGQIAIALSQRQAVSREFELQAQFRQAQKLESVGRLAAGVAHDLNNLLSPILGYSELLLADTPAGASEHHGLVEIKHAAERSRDLVQQLLAFARKQVLQTHLFDLRRVVSGMESLLRSTLREHIEIRIVLPPAPCAAMVDKGQIEQVLMNLVVNAQDAMPSGGELLLEVGPATLDAAWCAAHRGAHPGDYVCLRVGDTGHGMDPEVQAQAFEPFFTTKGVMGTGLGLSTVYGIVKQHGGYIWVDSEVGKGTSVSAYIPAVTTEVPETLAPAAPGRSPRGSEVVLIVEDNEQVRRLATLILSQQGYVVKTATAGREALEIASSSGIIDLLLTDVVMPDMNGKELWERLLALRPGLRSLFMSGYTPDVLGHQGVLDEGIAFLRKPFTMAELAGTVRAVLDQP